MIYSEKELENIGIKYGENVRISRSVNLYNADVTVGNNVRIDDYCIIKGRLIIGNNVHIGAFSIIAAGGAFVSIGNQVGISSRASLFTATEDFNSDLRGNPTLSENERSVISGPIIIGDKVIIGSGVTILPNVNISEGASLGANIILSRNIPSGIKVVNNTKLLKLNTFS
jgi:galactoside O-acetyltransferase